MTQKQYGIGDSSYRSAGELAGIIKLVNDFYDIMSSLPESKTIFLMHTDDQPLARKKLAYFLSGWLGGPKIYAENFGRISIPSAHRHLNIKQTERDAWLLCMERALEKQPYNDCFKKYLLAQFRVPAERILVACSHARPLN